MDFDCDAVVIGAGVAGSAAAILLARAGWSIVVVEQHAYPRRKVCGECIAPGNLTLLDDLGVGPEFHAAAGPELRRVGWMDAVATVSADMPACLRGAYRYGRALGRDRLDELLLGRARAVGVQVLQPARVRYVMGRAGAFECGIEPCARSPAATVRGVAGRSRLRTPIVIDAHGSWERGPFQPPIENPPRRRRDSDLFAFKATFRNTSLQPGYLPVLALHGGYGGMVVADDGRTTLACCIRRDALAACRAAAPGVPAGNAIERFLRGSCRGVREALRDAELDAPWLSVGPLRLGVRVGALHGPFLVGNAAGESHPLIGEGISMALQSSSLLAAALAEHQPETVAGRRAVEVHRAYAAAWRMAFANRLRLAAAFAHVAMRPALAGPVRALLLRWPALLCGGARLAGKAARAAHPSYPLWSMHEHA